MRLQAQTTLPEIEALAGDLLRGQDQNLPDLEICKITKPPTNEFSGSPTVWLSGSGGSGQTRLNACTKFGKPRPQRSGGAAVRCSRCWARFPGKTASAKKSKVFR